MHDYEHCDECKDKISQLQDQVIELLKARPSRAKNPKGRVICIIRTFGGKYE